MQQFQFTSKEFKGNMLFTYDEKGLLSKFENNAELNFAQIMFLARTFPFKIQWLDHITGNTGKLTEVTDLSFDNFWKLYAYKEGKIKAREQWEKLKDADKVAALTGIEGYRSRCKQNNVAMQYAERYIKNRRWEDGK